MKKNLFVGIILLMGLNALSQNQNASTVRSETDAVLKQTVFNTARFLRFTENSLTFNGVGYGVDIPGLRYTFTLSENTIIQIAETVRFTTTSCGVCPLISEEAWFKNSIVIDNEKFATFDYIGNNNKAGTSGGTVLAQLGPGTHTIKVHVAVNENAGDAVVHGYNKEMGNRTFMSLLFFPQE